MKELSIEEKAKAYDKVLEWATEAHKVCDGMLKEDLEHLFPELKESEDERIRKWLIALIKSNEYGNISNVGKMPCPKPNVLAWLEKQGEQKPTWSEEDENGLGDALWAIQQARTIAKDENDMGNLWYAEKWLKSLKERVRPKQEWSEEDERTYKSITYSFAHNYPLTVQQQEFVKSLKERYTWKPSDEQMDAILTVIGDERQKGSDVTKELLKVYHHLKKLKE